MPRVKMVEQQWRAVSGFETQYEVSDTGNVRSVERRVFFGKQSRTIPPKMLKPCLSKGYYSVGLWKDGKCSMMRVSRLVAMAFCHKPDGCDVVNHLDEQKTNNNSRNLEWTTQARNTRHSIAKITYSNVERIRSAKRGEGPRIVKELGISKQYYWNIRRAKSDKWIAA